MNLFTKKFPAFEELNQVIPPDQLRILKDQLDSENPSTPQSQFNFAWGLLKTESVKNQRTALDLLAKLYKEVPHLRRELLYYLALGSAKVGEYANARRYAGALVESEPDNTQFKALKEAIDEQVTQDGLLGLGIAGGVLALGIGIAGVLMRKRR